MQILPRRPYCLSVSRFIFLISWTVFPNTLRWWRNPRLFFVDDLGEAHGGGAEEIGPAIASVAVRMFRSYRRNEHWRVSRDSNLTLIQAHTQLELRSIIAILLGRLRMSANEALDAYKRVAAFAFTPKPLRLSPTSSKYSDDKLVEAIRNELGRAEASNGEKDALFIDLEAPKTAILAITKVNVDAGPTVFRTYSSEPAWKDCKIWEVARATSAATTFFDPIKTGRDQIAFIDAGFGYNNPCEVLIAEADKAIPNRDTSCIVSIGTGLGKAVGVSGNLSTLLRAMVKMATTSHKVHSRLQEKFGAEQPQKYWRFDEDVAISEIKMDNWKKLQDIAGHTHNYLNAYATAIALESCANSLITAKPNLRTSTFIMNNDQDCESIKANQCSSDLGASIGIGPALDLGLTTNEECARQGSHQSLLRDGVLANL